MTKEYTFLCYKKENLIIGLIIAYTLVLFFLASWVIYDEYKYNKLLKENVELLENEEYVFFSPLETWSNHPNWKFEYLFYNYSSYHVGIFNNSRYVLEYTNLPKNQSFELIFDLEENFSSIKILNKSCDWHIDYCYRTYSINQIKNQVTYIDNEDSHIMYIK